MLRSAIVVSLMLAAGAFGQSVDTIPFRAVLSSANETQQPLPAASGNATVWLHVVRDASGNVVSGSADAAVNYNFANGGFATAMHIHKAPVGVDGAIVLPFALDRTDVTTPGSFTRTQTPFPTSAVSLDTINGILADPSQFYFNVHSTDAPGGAMRGQLQRAEVVVRMGLMRPENETPPIAGRPWSGVGTVMMLVTRDSRGIANSAYVVFDVAYTGFPAGTSFTGLHVHAGPAQVAGPIVLPSSLTGQNPASATGAGNLHSEANVDLTTAGALDAVNGLISNPGGFYINVHTSDFPGGAMRAQLRTTDRMDFQVTMLPSNETPPVTGVSGQAAAKVSVFTLRNADASVAGGFIIFDVNPAFPTGTTFTGLHIHQGSAGQSGPIVLDSGLASQPILVADGTGNVTRGVSFVDAPSLAALNSLVVTPSNFYINIHTPANPSGVARAQLIAASTTLPAVTSVLENVTGATLSTLAPGTVFLINGTNFAAAGSDLGGFANILSLPASLNGVSVTIGGAPAPLLTVGPTQITGQVPFNVSAGNQLVVVTTVNGSSIAFQVRVATAAPAILYGPTGVVATRRSDGSAITPSNPAVAGDVIVVTAIGLGPTVPGLTAGAVVSGTQPYSVVADISARIGGTNTSVASAIAAPGLPGTYQVSIVVPQGIPSGNAPLLLQMGLITSNVVSVPVK